MVLVSPALSANEARPSRSWALTRPTLTALLVNSDTLPLQPAVPAGQETFSEATPFLTETVLANVATPAAGAGAGCTTAGRSTDSTSATASAASTVAVSVPAPPRMKSADTPRTCRKSLPSPASTSTGKVTSGETSRTSSPPSELSSNTSALHTERLN